MKNVITLIAVLVICSPGLTQAQDANAASTVKGSKSNTSERVGAPGVAAGADEATTVKGSKSNMSDRAAAQDDDKGGANAQGATSVKSGKSNTSD